MDKISGIIPGSSRVTSVDMKDSSPVRPGTPSFGRPERIAMPKEVAESSTQPTSQKGSPSQPPPSTWQTKDAAKAALVAKMSDNFFGHAPPPEPKESENENQGSHEMSPNSHQESQIRRSSDREYPVSNPSVTKNDEFGSLRAAQMRPVDSFGHEEQEEQLEEMPRMKQPDGLYPKGSFIDRTA
jgi:hypothetical protein